MNNIIELPIDVYSKIAAGEVIERPSSVVRELIDNSIDAGANEITIKVSEGGMEKIIVSDNGSGIEKDDFPLALKKHATSKIRYINDLLKLSTMGFRGEALASIAEISKTTITSNTDPEGKKSGYRLSNFDEKPYSIEPTASKKGTKIEVSDIFYNLPARKKFIKSASQEFTNIKKTTGDKALSNPEISFNLIHN